MGRVFVMAATILCTLARASAGKGLETAVANAAERVLGDDMAITGITVAKPLPWPKGAVASLEWRSAPKPGRMSVMVAVYVHDKVVGQGWVQLDLAPVKDVLVTTRAIPSGDMIGPGDVAAERRPYREDNAWQVEPRVLVGSPTLRNLAAGEIVTKLT